MKKKIIISPLIAMLLYVVLAGNATGPGSSSGVEGTGVIAAGCSCHNGTATSSTSVAVQLYNSTGTTLLSNYVAGGSYLIKVTGTQTDGALLLPRFGFQVSAMVGSSTSVNAGTLSAITGAHASSPSGVNIIEHSSALLATSGSGGLGTTYVVNIPWTAPAAGTGNVTLRSVINAVNFDGNSGPADKWNTGAAVMPELGAISGSNSVCQSGTTTLGNTVTGGTWSSSSPNATVSATGVVSGVSLGTAVITYTAGGNFVTKLMNINAAPAPITGTLSVCQGQTTTLADITGGGVWSSASSNVSVSGATITGLSAGTAVVSYTVGGCASTAIVSVNASSPITGTLAICQSATSLLNNTVTGGTWTSGNTAVATVNPASGLITGVTAGTSNITYSLPSGCNSVAVVTVNAQPSVIGGPAEVCILSTITATNTLSGGAWSAGTGTGSLSIDPSTGMITGNATGNVPITYTSAGGCTTTEVITVNPLPGAILGGFSGVCAGSSITLSSSTGGGTWTSGNTAMATIGATGILTGVSTTGGTAPITYTLGTGCRRVTNVNVIAISPISGVLSICPGQTSTLSSGPSGGTWSGGVAGIATVNPTTGLVSGIAAGTAGITYTSTSCSVNTVVTVGALPAITGGVNVCVGSTLALNNTTAGGTWSSSNTAVGTVNAGTGLVAGIANGTTTISYTTSGGCATGTVISVNALPGAITATGGGAFCGSTTISATGGTGGTIYFQGTTSAGTSTATPSSSQLISITGTYYFRALSAGGCWGSEASVAVTVNPAPAPITGLNAVCVGSTTTLSAASAGGTWVSSNTAAGTIGAATGLVGGIATGSTTITYTLPTGCFTTTTINVNALPVISAGSTSVCAGSSLTLSVTPAGGSWSSSNSSVLSYGSGDLFNALTAGTVTVSYTLSTGCYTTRIITVNPLPAAISGTASVCVGNTTALSSTTTGGTWSSGNTATGTVNVATGQVGGIAAGNTSITYTLPTGCMATATLTVNALPTAIAGPLFVCNGSTTTLNSTPAVGTWASSNSSVAGAVAATGAISGISPGTSTIIYTTAAGCARTAIFTVNALPGAITGTTSVCVGTTTSLGSTPTGGTWLSSNTGIATIGVGTGVATGVAVGTVTVTFTLATGCNTTTVMSVNPAATAGTITGSSSVCTGLTINLADVVSGGTWSSSSANATVSGSGVVTGVTAGTATISYTVVTACGTVIATKLITITTSATAGTIIGGLNSCVGVANTLSSTVTGGTWLSSNTAVVPVAVATGGYAGGTAGTANITYTINSACGTASTTATVTVNALPAANTGTAQLCVGATTLLSNTASGTWSSSNSGIASVGVSSAVVSGVAAGTAIVTFMQNTTSCTATTVVTVNALPGSITGSLALCTGGISTLGASPAGGTWVSSNTAVAIVGSGTGLAAAVAPGNTVISYILTTGCHATAVLTVNPVPGSISGSLVTCAGSTTTLTDITAGGSWNSSNTSVAGVGTGTGVVSGLLAGTTTISYTLPTGCRATAIMTVNALPAAITGTLSLCAGSNSSLADATAGGTWSSSAAGTAFFANPSVGLVSGAAAGNTTVTYTIATGCYTTAGLTVNPVPAAITGTQTVCMGASTTLSSTTSGGVWTSSNTAVATIGAGTGVVIPVLAGTSLISYITGAGCSVSAVVTVNALPGVISGSPTLCSGSTATLGSSPAGGTWATSGSGASVGVASGIVSGLSPGTAVISYTLGTGCARTITITVNALPAAITGASSICVGASTVLADLSAGGTWASSSTANATIGGFTGLVNGIAAGAATISYLLPTGCMATTIITVNALPLISGPSVVCSGSDIALSSSLPGGSWTSSAAGIAVVNATTGLVTGVAAGTATISNTTASGCVSTHLVTVNPLPSVAAVTGAASVCEGAQITLADATAGGVWSTVNSHAAISPAGLVTGLSAGVDTIIYTITTSCGSAAAVQLITVNPLPVAGIISGADTVCVGSSITLSSTESGGSWSSTTASALVTIGISSGTITGLSVGSLSISYTVTNGCGTAMATYGLTVNPAPDAGTVSGADTVCDGASITLSSSVAGGSWSSSSAATATVSAAGVVSGLASGTVTLSYIVTNSCGNDTATKTISVRSVSECTSRVDPLAMGEGIKVYPDPNKGDFTVELPLMSGRIDIIVMDMLGKVAASRNVDGKDTRTVFNLHLVPGNYIVRVNAGERVFRTKVVIR